MSRTRKYESGKYGYAKRLQPNQMHRERGERRLGRRAPGSRQTAGYRLAADTEFRDALISAPPSTSVGELCGRCSLPPVTIVIVRRSPESFVLLERLHLQRCKRANRRLNQRRHRRKMKRIGEGIRNRFESWSGSVGVLTNWRYRRNRLRSRSRGWRVRSLPPASRSS